jgi:succinate dehydrogenase / fumarate reductase, cytochrome b subunit
MSSRIRVLTSSVGTKLLIGVTGLALFLFLITHIAGNALIFFGPTTFNHYSATLLSNPLLPIAEIGLLLIFLMHAYKAVTMYMGNQQARPVAYVQKKSKGGPTRRSVSSQTMIITGLWLVLFVVIHVAGCKYGTHYEAPDGVRDLYRTVDEAFASPLIVAFYVLSMVIVASHLWHGVASAPQSLGLAHPRWTPRFLAGGKLLAAVIGGGFILITLWVALTDIGQVAR